MSPSELSAATQRARAAYPQLQLDDEPAFHRFLSEKPGAGEGLEVASLYLAWACARGDAAALALLEEKFIARLDGAIARAGAGHQIDEIKQQLRERLLVGPAARIADYAGRGDLLRWLRAAAARLAIDAGRRQKPELDRDFADAALEGELMPDDDPEAALMRQRYRAELKVALTTALAALEPAARSDLRLYYLDGVRLKELAALRSVAIATIHRRLQASRTLVFDQARLLIREQLKLDDRAVDSVLRLVGSRLDVSRRALDTR